jgi:predicted Zn-dependent protease
MRSARGGGLRDAQAVVETALDAAAGDEAVVIVEDRFDADVRFANNTTTTNGVRRDRRVIVAVMVEKSAGRSVGIASRSGAADVAELVARARADARDAPLADDDAPLLSGGPVTADYEDPPATTGLSILSGLLGELGEAFGRARSASRVLAGFATHEMATTYLGTTTGIRTRHVQPTGSVELVARSADGSASSWAGVGTADFADVSLSEIEARLVGRLGAAARRIDLPAGRYEVLLPPDAVADLVIDLAGAMGGRDAEDGGTVFSAPNGGTRLGERLTPLGFVLSSDPRAPGLECEPQLVVGSSGSDVSVFDNGAPLLATNWIDDGHLARLRYHRVGAERSGEAFTPPIDNLRLELPGATASLEDLIASTDRGLLLTCLWYIREVDPATLLLTGLTRDGVYLVEKGEITGAVNNFRFNESPLDMLTRVTAAGATTRSLSREWGEWMNRTAMPALRVADFNMSTVSQAS